MYAWALLAHPYNEISSDQSAVIWIRSFTEPDLVDNNVPLRKFVEIRCAFSLLIRLIR